MLLQVVVAPLMRWPVTHGCCRDVLMWLVVCIVEGEIDESM